MPEDRTEIVVDSQQAISSILKTANAWEKIKTEMSEAIVVAERYNKEETEITQVLRVRTKAGEAFNVTLKESEGIIRAVGIRQTKFKKTVEEIWREKLRDRDAIEAQNAKLQEQIAIMNQAAAAAERLAAAQAKRKQRATQQANAFSANVQRGVAIPESATAAEVFKYKAAVASAAEAVQKHNISAKKAGQIWRDVQDGKFKAYRGALGDAQRKMFALKNAQDGMGKAAKSAADKATASQKRMTAQTQKATKTSKSLLLSWESVLRLTTIQVAHRALSSLINNLEQGFTRAVELQIALAEIQTISKNISFGDLSSGVRELSDAFSLDILDQAEAAYQTLSNQIAKTDFELFNFIQTSNEFALITRASVADSVNLLSSIINAYSLDVSEAEAISANFFKTIEFGRLRAEDIANSIGRVSVFANQLGVDYTEVNAALALFTINGVKANEAMTFLRNIFQKLIRPSKAMRGLFADLGVESAQAAIQTFGFTGFLQKLEERTNGSSEAVGELFQRIRAISGALLFTGDNLKRYEQILADSTAGSESFARALELVTENTGRNLREELNKLRNFFTQDLANPFLDQLGGATNDFKTLTATVEVLAITLRSAVIPAILTATTALVVFRHAAIAAAATNPFTIGLVLLTTAFALHGKAAREAVKEQSRQVDMQKELQDSFLETAGLQSAQLSATTKAINRELNIRLQDRRIAFADELGDLHQQAGEQTQILEDLADNIEKITVEISDSYEKMADVSNDELSSLLSQSASLKESILSLRASIGDSLFEFDLSQLDGIEKIDALTDRIIELESVRRSAVAGGDIDEFERITSVINGLVSQRRTLLAAAEEEGLVEKEILATRNEIEAGLHRELALRGRLSAEVTRRAELEGETLLRLQEQQLAQERLGELASVINEDFLAGKSQDFSEFESIEQVQQFLDKQSQLFQELSNTGIVGVEELLQLQELLSAQQDRGVTRITEIDARSDRDALSGRREGISNQITQIENLLRLDLDARKEIVTAGELLHQAVTNPDFNSIRQDAFGRVEPLDVGGFSISPEQLALNSQEIENLVGTLRGLGARFDGANNQIGVLRIPRGDPDGLLEKFDRLEDLLEIGNRVQITTPHLRPLLEFSQELARTGTFTQDQLAAVQAQTEFILSKLNLAGITATGGAEPLTQEAVALQSSILSFQELLDSLSQTDPRGVAERLDLLKEELAAQNALNNATEDVTQQILDMDAAFFQLNRSINELEEGRDSGFFGGLKSFVPDPPPFVGPVLPRGLPDSIDRGSPIQNSTDVGGITINLIGSGSNQQDAIEIADALEREIQNGSISSFS